MNLKSLGEIPSPTAAKGFFVNGEVDDVTDDQYEAEGNEKGKYSGDESSQQLPNNEDSNNSGQNHEDKLCGSRHFYFNSLVRFVAYFLRLSGQGDCRRHTVMYSIFGNRVRTV